MQIKGSKGRVVFLHAVHAWSVTDRHPVYKRTVSAAQVAHANGRRIQVQQAVMPRNCQVFQFVGQPDFAIVPTAHQALPGAIETVLLTRKLSVHYGECDMPMHRVPPSSPTMPTSPE